MIVKQTKGKGFFGCLKYVMEKAGAVFIEGNVDAFSTIRNMARDFRFNCEANRRVTRPVYHATLSIPPEDQGKLNDLDWGDVARRFLTKMNFCADFDDPDVPHVPYIVVRHTDRDHDHIHIVAGRVRTDGTCVSDSWDYRWGEKAVRELEVEFGLSQPFKQTNRQSAHPYLVEKLERIYQTDNDSSTVNPVEQQTPEISQADPIAEQVNQILDDRRQLQENKTRRDSQKKQKQEDKEASSLNKPTKKLPNSSGPSESATPSTPSTLPELINQVCQEVKTIPEFLKTLKDKGVEATVKLTRNRCVKGIVYDYQGERISGTKLGAAYTFPGLQKRLGLQFNPRLHLAEIEQHNRRCQPESNSQQWQWLQEIACCLDQWLTKTQRQRYQAADFQVHRDKDWLVVKAPEANTFFKVRYDHKKQAWLPQEGWTINLQAGQLIKHKLSLGLTTSARKINPNYRKR